MPYAPGYIPPTQTESFSSPVFDIAFIKIGAEPLKSLDEYVDEKVYLAPGDKLNLIFKSNVDGTIKHHRLIRFPDTWITEEVSYAAADGLYMIQGEQEPGLAYKFEFETSGASPQSDVCIIFSE